MFHLTFWLWVAVSLHAGFAILEMWPFDTPILLVGVMESWHVKGFGEPPALDLVSTIVRNAGAYNVIMTAGFLYCLFPAKFGFPTDPQNVNSISRFFFFGALFAGLFGGSTLGWPAFLQAVVGAAGIYCISRPSIPTKPQA